MPRSVHRRVALLHASLRHFEMDCSGVELTQRVVVACSHPHEQEDDALHLPGKSDEYNISRQVRGGR